MAGVKVRRDLFKRNYKTLKEEVYTLLEGKVCVSVTMRQALA